MSDPAQPASTPPPPRPADPAPPGQQYAGGQTYAGAQPHAGPHPYPGAQPSAGGQPYAAPYAAPRPPAGAVPPPATPARSSVLGAVALGLGILATVGATVVGSIATWQIGLGAGRAIASHPRGSDFDWSLLAPVREHVLAGELSFWIGTALGVAALVLGLVAIVTGRGRVTGIVATVIAALGPILFLAVAAVVLSTAMPIGAGIGG